jgi:hypothetical protein
MELIPPQVTEIDIELYHYRLGQFNTVLNKINNQLGPDLKQKIKNIYTSKKQYQQFSQQLKAQIKKIKQHSARKFFFIVPDFDKFYLPTITYHDQL